MRRVDSLADGTTWRRCDVKTLTCVAVNGFEFDGSTQFEYVSFADTLKALAP